MPYSIQFLPGHRAREVEVELVFGVVDALGRLLGLRRLRLLRLKKDHMKSERNLKLHVI